MLLHFSNNAIALILSVSHIIFCLMILPTGLIIFYILIIVLATMKGIYSQPYSQRSEFNADIIRKLWYNKRKRSAQKEKHIRLQSVQAFTKSHRKLRGIRQRQGSRLEI